MALNSETKSVTCIINFPRNCNEKQLLESLKSWLNSNSEEYYFIVHDKDTKIVDGIEQLKTKHIHLLFKSKDKKHRLTYYINNISSALNISNLLISIEIWKGYQTGIQYLIHKNDSDKFQYQRNKIVTNQELSSLDLILDRDSTEHNIDFDYLATVVAECKGNLIHIMEKLGIDTYKKYRYLIVDLIGHKRY